MRVLVAILALSAVAGLASPLSIADDGGRHASPPPGAHGDPPGGSNRGERPAASGEFTVAAQAIHGDYVSFTYNDTTLQAFTVDGVALLDATVAGASEHRGRAGTEADGAQVRVRTSAFELQVHDNPEAVTQMRADGSIALTFVPGVTVGADGRSVNFTVGNLTGTITGSGLAVAGQTVTAQGRFLLRIDAPRGAFDVHHPEIQEAVSDGRVGAEAAFNKPGADVEKDVVSYGNVTVSTIEAETGNITLQVQGNGTDGRVLVLDIDGRVLGASHAGDLNVLFDNASALHADNLSDVLNVNDGVHAEYYVVFDPAHDAFQLIVSVPHYSVHTLSVTTALVLPPPSVVVGVVAGLAVLAPSAFLLFRRK